MTNPRAATQHSADPYIAAAALIPETRGVRSHDAQHTRHLILVAAANLFASEGYTATTTRQIAAEVGVRQPSLFYHFPSKQAILDSLLSISIERINNLLTNLVDRKEDPAIRLMAYMFIDAAHVLSCPYNLLGLHADDVLAHDDFQYWRHQLDALHRGIRKLISQGVSSGSFIAVDPKFGQWMVTGAIYATMRIRRETGMARPQRRAWQAARLTARIFLADPHQLDRYQAEASQLACKIVADLPDSTLIPGGGERFRSGPK